MKSKRKNLVFFLLLAVVYFAIKSCLFRYPLHNDEFNHMEGVSKIVEENFFPFTEWWSYHPPFVYELVALFNSVLSKENWILGARLITAVFGFLVLVLTFLLAKRLFNENTARIAVIILFFLPIFQAQTSLFHLAIPLTFFFLLTYYFYLKERWFWYLVSGIALVLTKEIGTVIILAISFFDFISNVKNPWKAARRMALLNLPQIFFLIWLFLNKKYLGWYLWPYNVEFLTKEKSAPTLGISYSLLVTNFISVGKWILTLIALVGLVCSFWSKKFKRTSFPRGEILFGLFIFLFFPLFFGQIAYLPRYTLFTFVLVLIVVASFIDKLMEISLFRGVLGLLAIILVLLLNWFHNSDRVVDWAGERNYGYLNIVDFNREVVDYVNTNYRDQSLIAHYPLDVAFSNPLAGYVDSETCRDVEVFDLSNLTNFQGVIVVPNIFLSPQIWIEINQMENLELLKIIKNRGFEARVLRVRQDVYN